jgi:protein SCO1/2
MKRLLLVVVLILVGLGCFAAGWLFHSGSKNKERLPVLGTVPNYTLIDQLGHQVSSTSFAGKVRIVTFLFPYCTSYCPLTAHNFVSLSRVLKASGIYDQIQLVAFDVDPDHTGPDQMRTFQKQYGWDPEDTHWEYLTGKPEDVRHVVYDSYHIYYKQVDNESEDREAAREKMEGTYVPQPVVSNKLADKANVNYDIVHNDALVIVDTHGRIRKYFHEADRVSNEQIMDVIYQLLPPGSKTATP